MLASASAASEIIRAASSTSVMVMSGPPVILKSTPLAPSIETSRSGEEMAARAAIWARLSPTPLPMPIRADPASTMMVLTSAKSTLISPGTVMISEMPWTPWVKTESATRKASRRVILRSTTSKSRWLGITIRVSTLVLRISMPSSALTMRRVPSKVKGLVTMATVRAPTSLATSAMTGAAPVPVPPPMPAVIKTISESTKNSLIFSRDSSAACSPMSGLPPDPRPRVRLSPI